MCADDAAPVPDDATVTVQLLDVSLADAPSVTVAEQVIEHPAEGPLAFTLPYDPAAMDPRASYTVSARVTRGDELLFVSDTHNPVLTRGAPDRRRRAPAAGRLAPDPRRPTAFPAVRGRPGTCSAGPEPTAQPGFSCGRFPPMTSGGCRMLQSCRAWPRPVSGFPPRASAWVGKFPDSNHDPEPYRQIIGSSQARNDLLGPRRRWLSCRP